MSAQQKHTPGPWELGTETVPVVDGWNQKKKTEKRPRVITHIARFPIPVAIPCVGGGISDAQQQANAALIASAPELLAACKELLGIWPLVGYELEAFCDNTLIPMMLAAVKKAEGK